MLLFLKILFPLILLGSHLFSASSIADIESYEVCGRINEVLQVHPSYREWNRDLVKRLFITFLREIDPMKVCFFKKEFDALLKSNDEHLQERVEELKRGDFSFFEKIFSSMPAKIARLQKIYSEIEENMQSTEPSNASIIAIDEWPEDDAALFNRIVEIDALQKRSIDHLTEIDQRNQAFYTIRKLREQYIQLMTPNPASDLFKKTFYTLFLKAFCQALDSESAFLSPREVQQLMMNFEQRLFGIGVILRDECDGLAVIEIIENGPSHQSKEILIRDKIIAVDGTPIIGMNVEDAVQLIRGVPKTSVQLTVIRSGSEGRSIVREITLIRDEVVLDPERVKSVIEECQDGSILSLQLPLFYQDDRSSSYQDLLSQIERAQKSHDIRGIVLDLRNNPGGFLPQAVMVAGLFLDKGIVVSVKDANGAIRHLRNADTRCIWDGPLIVLVSRMSASASEIVAQTLQDWGRALIVGDDRTFGKGSFQAFTHDEQRKSGQIYPKGEFKITLGRYYTVSGKSPQRTGVSADIEVPGSYRFRKIGEKFLLFPLTEDAISPNFIDRFDDFPFYERRLRSVLYADGKQERQVSFTQYLPKLQLRSFDRISKNSQYKEAIAAFYAFGDEEEVQVSKWRGFCDDKEVKNKLFADVVPDYQLKETLEILKDLIYYDSYGVDASMGG